MSQPTQFGGRAAKFFRGLACCVVMWAHLGEATAQVTTPPRVEGKKLIATGWDNPTPAQFRGGVAAFGASGIFSGAVIQVNRAGSEGEVPASWRVFSRDEWAREEFFAARNALAAAAKGGVTENFLTIIAAPGDVDWFDDEGWARVVDHWRQLAWLAKQGGMRGLSFDAEPYNPPASQFAYLAQAGRATRSFAQYEAKARQRGREVMAAVKAEYPDITILSYRLLCDLVPRLGDLDSEAAAMLAGSDYGLLPAFVDGWLRRAGPAMRLVEGNENAYTHAEPEQFARDFTRLRLDGARLVSAASQKRFRAQYLIGHGLYLDAHVEGPEFPYHVAPLGGSRAARLAWVTRAALAAADEYVWVYGEQAKWWASGTAERTWAQAFPGVERALRLGSRPSAEARALFAEAPGPADLCVNGDFSITSAGGAPEGWWTWQEGEGAAFAVVDGAATITGAKSAVYGQDLAVEAGGFYALQYRIRREGGGAPSVRVRWKRDGRWAAESEDVVLQRAVGADGATHSAAFAVPRGVDQLVLMLAAGAQAEGDVAWFDDVRLARVNFE